VARPEEGTAQVSNLLCDRTGDEDLCGVPRFTGASSQTLAKATANLVVLVHAHDPARAKKLEAEILTMDAQDGFGWALTVVEALPRDESRKLKIPITPTEFDELRRLAQDWKQKSQGRC
jgi:hypothetical protein